MTPQERQEIDRWFTETHLLLDGYTRQEVKEMMRNETRD